MPPHAPDSLLSGGEQERLAALHRSGQLDTPPEAAFDRVVHLAARVLGVPVALISLVEPHRQFFKSAVGLPEPVASRREMPLSHSFCRHVVAAEAPLVVEDAREYPLVRDNPAVRDLRAVAYLGVPLRAPTGEVLGSLCAIDHEPRAWSAEDEQTLGELAAVLTSEMELRASVRRLEAERRAHTATRSFTRTALDTLDDVFFVLDPLGRVVRWNRKALEVSGYTDDELTALSIDELFAEEDRERVREALSDVFRLGQGRVEAGLVTRAGREIPYEFTGALMKDEQGEPTGICGIGRDIAEQQAAEGALRASEARFRSFVEATAQVVWRADAAGAVVELGDAWSTFTGQTPEEIAGWGWTEAIHPEDAPRLAEEWAGHVASQTPFMADYRVRRHDGAYHWFTGLTGSPAGPSPSSTKAARSWSGWARARTSRSSGARRRGSTSPSASSARPSTRSRRTSPCSMRRARWSRSTRRGGPSRGRTAARPMPSASG